MIRFVSPAIRTIMGLVLPGFQPTDLTGELIKAARALLRLKVEDLAEDTQLGLATIKRAEATSGRVTMTASNATRIIAALEARGIEWLPGDNRAGPGIRLKSPA